MTFDDFYRRYHDDVLRFVVKRFGADEAEDIVQETMLRALARYDTVSDGRPAWTRGDKW